MSLRDLQFPQDAFRVVDSLHDGLNYDSAISVLGNLIEQMESSPSKPDFAAFYRNGGKQEDAAVRKDSRSLLSRFSFIQMLCRFEDGMNQLLLQCLVLRELGISGGKIDSGTFWKILESREKVSRRGVRTVCLALANSPDALLTRRLQWLDGLIRVRNCLIHRFGVVQMVDCLPPNSQLRGSQDSDRMTATWMKLFIELDDGSRVDEVRIMRGSSMKLRFEEYSREWKVGDTIEISPDECQDLSRTLSMIANSVLACFEREMNALLKLQEE